MPSTNSASMGSWWKQLLSRACKHAKKASSWVRDSFGHRALRHADREPAWTPENDLLTTTLKLKRPVIAKAFEADITDAYKRSG